MNLDFDALASVIAAKKLHPEAQVVLSNKKDRRVKDFLSIYRDTFDFVYDHTIDWSKVTHLILVDVANLNRVSHLTKHLNLDHLCVTIYDHHPKKSEDIKADDGLIEEVGATITLLVEQIKQRKISLTPLEATLFGLGVYTDTGFFTYKHTTDRDLKVASYLLKKGMNLNIVRRFTEQALLPEQQQLLDELFHEAELFEIEGLNIVLSTTKSEKYIGGLALVTEKMLSINGASAVINVVEMNKRIYIVGRASSPRISLLPILKKWGGGGHRQAGSALVREGDRFDIYQTIKESLQEMLMPAIVARDIMSSPVKTISPDTTIKEAGDLMYRYGHSGYPIVEKDELVGLITRRDLDKANHHGLGHAPVKAYMSTNIITITPEDTLEEIQQTVIDHNVGRLPVIENGELVGILTRTNIIEAIHSEAIQQSSFDDASENVHENIQEKMKKHLPEKIYTLLKDIGRVAEQTNIDTYLVGGIVRDIFLKRPNDDIDIVVEGDGIQFAKKLQQTYGGKIITHEDFGTATWQHPSDMSIDIASSRLEYYEQPASLPDVERSTLKEDLYRRDFTINAIAICLNEDRFGRVVDPFSGQKDLLQKKVKVLHNLSFVEDPTRIFRAVRFEARFNFMMDEQTKKLALYSIEKIKDLSKKRILNEMELLFTEIPPHLVIKRLFAINFWQQFNIQSNTVSQCEQHAKQLRRYLAKDSVNQFTFKTEAAFKYFLIPFFQDDQLDEAKSFALKKHERKMIEELSEVSIQSLEQEKQLGHIHRHLNNISKDTILFLITSNQLTNHQFVYDYLLQRQSLPTYVTGDDLLAKGIKRGPIFAKLLFELDVAILNGDINSKEEANKWIDEQLNQELE